MIHFDILIPPSKISYSSEAADQARTYIETFGRAGIGLRPLPWTDPAAGQSPALALLAWGYHLDLPRWLGFLNGWPSDIPLFNPAALMLWNTRKTYLTELEAAGVTTVPTWFGDASPATVAAAFDDFASHELIVKPQVSAGSYQTSRVTRSDPPPSIREAMIQPFLPAIAEEGEYSLFYIGGELTHAIVKRATGGDFRIQPQFGGVNEPWAPDAEALAVAKAALNAAPLPPVYVRIDLLRRLDGRLALIEFEAIEPDLYFHHGNEALERLAQDVARVL